MNKHFKSWAASLLGAMTLLAATGHATAQRLAAEPKVLSELTVSAVVKAADGKEQLQAVQAVKPGDLLQYTSTYKNAGTQPVKQLVATLPVPTGTEYTASSNPTASLASLDGKVFEAVPLMRKVKQPDGRLVDVPVPIAEYRFLRWKPHDLAAGASYGVSARVQVISGANAAVGAGAPASAAR